MMYCFVTRQLVEQRVTHIILKRNMLTHLIVKPGKWKNISSVITTSKSYNLVILEIVYSD